MHGARAWGLAAALLLAAAAALAGRPFGPVGGERLRLVQIPEVQRELKLDDGQLARIAELNAEMRERLGGIFQHGLREESPEERERRFRMLRELTAKYECRLDEILEPRQSARLRQLELQRAGVYALGRADVAAELRLTPEQRQRLRAVFEGQGQAFREAFQSFGRGPGMSVEDREAIRRKVAELQEQTAARALAVLTEAQRRQFQQMQGPPFAFPPRHSFSADRFGRRRR